MARRIQQQLGREDHEQAATERRVRALLAELKRPAAGMHLKALDPHGTERGLAALQTAGREFASAATAVCGGVSVPTAKLVLAREPCRPWLWGTVGIETPRLAKWT